LSSSRRARRTACWPTAQSFQRAARVGPFDDPMRCAPLLKLRDTKRRRSANRFDANRGTRRGSQVLRHPHGNRVIFNGLSRPKSESDTNPIQPSRDRGLGIAVSRLRICAWMGLVSFWKVAGYELRDVDYAEGPWRLWETPKGLSLDVLVAGMRGRCVWVGRPGLAGTGGLPIKMNESRPTLIYNQSRLAPCGDERGSDSFRERTISTRLCHQGAVPSHERTTERVRYRDRWQTSSPTITINGLFVSCREPSLEELEVLSQSAAGTIPSIVHVRSVQVFHHRRCAPAGPLFSEDRPSLGRVTLTPSTMRQPASSVARIYELRVDYRDREGHESLVSLPTGNVIVCRHRGGRGSVYIAQSTDRAEQYVRNVTSYRGRVRRRRLMHVRTRRFNFGRRSGERCRFGAKPRRRTTIQNRPVVTR